MKYFSKLLSMLLVGAMLTVTACTDYDEDIKNLNQKVDDLEKELVEGQIDPLKADLAATKAALESAIADANAKVAENKAAIEALEEADAAQDAAIEAANKAIADAVVNLEGQLAELEAALEAKHAEDIAAIEKKIADEVATLNTAIETANKEIKANADAIAANEAAIDALDKEMAEAIEEATAEITKNAEAIAKNAEAIAKNADAIAENATKIANNADAIATNKAAIEANAADIAKLQSDLLDLTTSFTAYQATTDAAIADLKARMEVAEKKIADLEANVEELYELHDVQNVLIQGLDTRLEDLAQYTQDQLDLLAETDAALQALIEALDLRLTDLENSFIDYQKIVNDQLAKAFGQIAVNKAAIEALEEKHDLEVKSLQAQDEAILRTLEQHAGWILALEEEMLQLHDAQNIMINALSVRIEELAQYTQDQLDAINARMAELDKKIDKVKMDLEEQVARVDEHVAKALAHALEAAATAEENAKAYTDELEKAVEAALGKLAEQIDQVNAYAVAIETDLKEYQDKIDGTLAVMTIDIKQLMDRIQSIVYVPTKSNHKADVVALFYDGQAGNTRGEVLVSEGYVEMTFRVTPIDAAEQLVTYFANQTDKEMPIFAFEGEEVVLTRGTEEAYGLTINSIRIDDVNQGEGRFIVNATPHLPADFYNEEISYSVALRLQKGFKGDVEGNEYSADLVSDYVNLELAKDYIDGLVLRGEQDDKEIFYEAGETVEYEIAYADLEARVELLEGLEPRYVYTTAEGVFYCTAEDLAARGYNVDDIVIECEHDAFKKDATEPEEKIADANFAFEEKKAESGHEIVKLTYEKEPTKDAIGNHLDTEHCYTIAEGLCFDFYSCVAIVKEHRDATLGNIKYKWNYTDYREYTKANTVLYEGASREFVLEVSKSDIPADILAENGKFVVDGYNYPDNVKVVVTDANDETKVYEGEYVVEPVMYEEKDGKAYWTVAVSGWQFDNTDWNVEVTYEFEEIEVVLHFGAKFISLQDLEYVHETPVEFVYDLSKSYETTLKGEDGKELKLAEVLAANYEGLVGENGHFATVEDLAEGIWYNTGKTANYNTVRTDALGKEKSVLSKNDEYQSALNSKPWSFLRFYKSPAGLNEMVVKVYGSDIVSDYDTFAMTSDFTTKFQNKLMKVTVKSTTIVKMPELYVVHVPYVVKEVAEPKSYYSEVVGLWNPNNKYESAVSAFTAQDIDLRSGFEVVIKNDKALNGYTVLTQEELDAMNVTFEFELDDDYTACGLGITLDETTKTVLSYMGWAPLVGVNGTLRIDGIEKRNAFAEYNDRYVVKKFDPIGEFIVEENAVISTAEATAYYTKNIFEDIQLFDVRGRELIDATNYVSPVDATDPTIANLAFDADHYTPWVIGDDVNGFASGVAVDDVFSLTNISFDYEVTDKDGRGTNFLDKYLDKTKVQYGLFVFSNLNNLKLQEDIFVNVYVTVSYPWCEEKTGTIRFRVTSDKIEKPTTPEA